MIVCIIQARTGSTRLPRKVLKQILGKPMLSLQLERVKKSKLIDLVIVATTTKKEDDSIVVLTKDMGVDCFRGSEDDVLDRYYHAAKKGGADIVIRLMADCPLSDPGVIDETIEYFLKNKNKIDYTSKPINYPEGLDVEIFSFEALEHAWKEAVLPSEREHVTPYIYNHPEIFDIQILKGCKDDLSMMHWSVDTLEDFKFVTKIFEKLYPLNHLFSKDDILCMLRDSPELLKLGSGGTGYEGYKKSIIEDKEYKKKSKIYEKLIGFKPEVLILLSAGTVRETGEDSKVFYRSTRVDEGDGFGTLFGEARVIATAELAKHFSKTEIITTSKRPTGKITHAQIIRDELENLSINRGRILLEEESNDTLSQIGETLKIVCEKGWRNVVFITNEYQISRAKAMYKHFGELSFVNKDTKSAVGELKSSEVKVSFVSAEDVLPYRDHSFIKVIDKMKKTDNYKKRLENEQRGVKMVLSGEYGKKESASEDKIERQM